MLDLNRVLYELCLEIAAIWQNPLLLGSPSKSLPKVVVTLAEKGAPLLPRRKLPIRGQNRVVTNVREGKLQDAEMAEHLVSEALLDPWGHRSDAPEVREARVPLNAKIKEVFSIFKKIDSLPERLFESLGFKHYEPEEVRRLVRVETDDREIIWKLLLASAIGRALASLHFDPARKGEFGQTRALKSSPSDVLF